MVISDQCQQEGVLSTGMVVVWVLQAWTGNEHEEHSHLCSAHRRKYALTYIIIVLHVSVVSVTFLRVLYSSADTI